MTTTKVEKAVMADVAAAVDSADAAVAMVRPVR